MKKRILKVIGVIIFVIVILFGGVFTYRYFNEPLSVYDIKEFRNNGNPVLDSELSKEQVSEDIDYIINIMESTHPIFLEEVPEQYYAAKDELLAVKDKNITVGELQNRVSKYLSSVQDGHTALWWTENMFLNIDWKYKDGKLYLLDENKNLTNKIVTKIENVRIEDIVETVKNTFPAENYVAEGKNIERYAKGRLLLESTGVDFARNIKISCDVQGREESLSVEFTRESYEGYGDSSIYSKVIDENIAYIRLGTCDVNLSLETVVMEIEEYKKNNIKDYIIDVIDNPGGNSQACTMLLEALGMKPGSYGGVIRFSPLAQEQRGYLRKSGSITYSNNNEVVKNEDINLYILTNEVTFSSAQMLAVWVSDGNLGKIVGRPSSNMPSNYGDIIYYQLENSKLSGQISHKKWTRPNASKDKERVLEPDIYVEYGDDILERALEEIKQ